MVQEIIWSPEATAAFLEIISYLRDTWTEKEVNEFADRVDEKLEILKSHPRVGGIKNKRLNIRQTVIHKKVVLIYKYKPRKKEVYLLKFWNTLKDPNKVRY
jgi:plasmid stabilization system protein ParE